jgi:hypothetical protein
MRSLRRLAPSITASIVGLGLFAVAGDARADAKKFALAMPHFNVQYVAGGMNGFWPTPDPRLDLSAEQIEDLIIQQSFEPLLDLFAAHPTWATNVEMQGYMLDVIAARHPTVLAKLKDLSSKGQIEVVSFHYSDQLFLAHAPDDLLRSADLDTKTFADLGITRGAPVFCQEGQAGLGMAAVMKTHGESVMVWPKNLWSYQHTDPPAAPLLQFGTDPGVTMTTTHGGHWDLGGGNTVDVSWTFVDDGELLMTGGRSPYTPDVFIESDKAKAEYEKQLSDLETAGYQITTVSKFAEQVKPLQALPAPPPLLDGTWQPDSTDGMSKWLGMGGLHKDDERDDDVHTLAAIAHRELEAAETMAKSSGIDARADLDAAWRLLALGEVSDASGINPFRGEVEYGLAHCAEALRIARATIDRGKQSMGATKVSIDPSSSTVTPSPPDAPAPTTIAAPIDVTVDGGERNVTVAWTQVGAHSVATVTFAPGAADDGLTVTVHGAAGIDVGYTPALTTTPIHVPRSAFVWDHYMLPLNDGLLAIDANKWLLADQAFVHVAARISMASGDVVFHDETERDEETVVWVFHVFDGDDATAAAASLGLNTLPAVVR